MNEIKQRILTVMGTVFEMDTTDIPENATPKVVKNWDSLKHMNLILALEDEFQLRFSDDEITDLLDLPTIILIISEKVESQR
jgi:acyl carrier protein